MSEDNIPLILQLFTKSEQEEFKEENNGTYRGPCPDCGHATGGSECLVLFPETNTAYCHKSNSRFNLLELIALKIKYLQCNQGRQNDKDKSPIYGEDFPRKEFFADIRNEFPVKVIEAIEEATNRNLMVEKIDTEVSITESIVDKKEPLNFDFYTKLLSSINNLPNFNLFNDALGLIGEGYTPFKKSLWYICHSLIQPELTYEINHKTKIDNRKHLLIITPPAGGKSTTKQFTKMFVEKGEYIEASGISNPEQLVGKMIYPTDPVTKKKKPKENKGILGFKLVLYDEAQELINEGVGERKSGNEVYAKSQRLKRQAMDTFGENIISKKLVDDTKEDMMAYPSPSRIIDFAHPKKLESPFFDTGSFRRYEIFNLTSDTEIKLLDVTEFKLEPNNAKEDYFKKLFTEESKNLKYDTKFNQKTLDFIAYTHAVILDYLLNHKNENAFRYGLLTRYSVRNIICKNVYILALSKGEKEPSLETTLTACCDTILFILKSIEAINDLGDIGASTDLWRGLKEPDVLSLLFLLKQKALTAQTSEITIKKFLTILSHFYGCKNTSSRSHYYRLKKEGYIDSTQIDQHKSRVWITYIPKSIKLNTQGFDPITTLDKLQGVLPKNSVFTPLKEFVHDDKLFEKLQGVKGVGILALYYILYTRFVPKNKNKNIYIYSPDSNTPFTPSDIPKEVSSIKHIDEGVKEGGKQKHTLKLKKHKTDREIQFYDAKECKHILPNHTQGDILFWLQDNKGSTFQQIYERFGVGSLKFKNELVRSKKIIKEDNRFFVEKK